MILSKEVFPRTVPKLSSGIQSYAVCEHKYKISESYFTMLRVLGHFTLLMMSYIQLWPNITDVEQ